MNKKLLKNRNYMLVVLGNFVSLLGSNIQQFVLSLYVLALTGSATLFASMLAISILPRIILSPIAGVFGDWFNKKKSIVILDIVNAIVIAGFAVMLFYNDVLTIGWIYLLVVLLEITEIFFHSSMSAVIPSVVEKDQLLEANSLRTMVVSFGQLMAPIIGALIYGVFGLFIALIINAVSFLLSAISELFIVVPKSKSENNQRSIKGFKKDVKEGFKLIKNSKPIRTLIAIAVVVNFSIAPLFSVGLIFLLREVLLISEIQLGLFQTILISSMVIAPMLLTRKLKKLKLGDVLTKSFILVSFLIALISVSVFEPVLNINNGMISYIYVIVISFFIGIIVTAVNISVNTMIQRIVPIEFMGRTSTVLGLFTAISIPVGQMLFGVLYDIINPGLVIIFNGFIILIAVLYYYKRIKMIDGHTEEIENEIKMKELNQKGVVANEI
ncbi:MAG: MFS transporter [Bacillota bacterium]